MPMSTRSENQNTSCAISLLTKDVVTFSRR